MITQQTIVKLAQRLETRDTSDLTKLAKIMGAAPDFYNTGGSYKDFTEVNAPAYNHYLNAKAQEEPSSKWTAGLTGAAIGAIPGLAMDLNFKTKGLFTGLTAGLGALIGVGSQVEDERRIEEAKMILASTDKNAKVKLALLRELSMRNDSDRNLQRRANRHTVYQTFKN